MFTPLHKVWKSIRSHSLLDHRRSKEPDGEGLLVPREWISYPIALPPPPSEMLAHREEYEAALLARRQLPHPKENDTALHTLFRLYESIVLDWNIGMRNEIEYFFRNHTWPVSAIPDPEDANPTRYAVLACIPFLLVEAFNHNIELGLPRDAPGIMTDDEIDEMKDRNKIYERVPDWVHNVPPLLETLRLPHYDPLRNYALQTLKDSDDARASEAFRKKNILIWQPHILFI